MECDDVLVAVGQENAFPWIERDIGLEFDQVGHAGGRSGDVSVDQSEGLLRRRRGVRPQEHHLGRGAWPRGGGLDRPVLQRRRREGAARRRWSTCSSQKMGIHEWSYDNDVSLDLRFKVPHAPKELTLKRREHGSGARLQQGARLQGGAALPQLRYRDGVRREPVHRVRRLRRHLPGRLHHLHAERSRAEAAPAI